MASPRTRRRTLDGVEHLHAHRVHLQLHAGELGQDALAVEQAHECLAAVVPNLVQLPEVSYFDRIPFILPNPLVVENNQRPFPIPN